jgi:hypothetical protein
MAGHDRFVADIRPLMEALVARRDAAWLLAIVTDAHRNPLGAPLTLEALPPLLPKRPDKASFGLLLADKASFGLLLADKASFGLLLLLLADTLALDSSPSPLRKRLLLKPKANV